MSLDSGEYSYGGKTVNFKSQKELTKFRRNEVGFVVQYFALADDLNIFQNVALPLKYQGHSRKRIKELVMEALRELEIEDKAKAYPSELSGGQQQRAAIARAIERGKTVIIVTHDAKVAGNCERTIYLKDGMILDDGLGGGVHGKGVII